MTRTDLFYGGPSYIAGYCPTGEDTLYAYIVEDAQDRSTLTPQEQLAVMRGPVRRRTTARGTTSGERSPTRPGSTTPGSRATCSTAPWNRGRVVLIGDAAHACPPTLAQGAAQALEDAAVLAELLLARDALDDDLWQAFTDRRFERAKTVVEASLQLCRGCSTHERGDVPGLMARIAHLLSEPAA